jgi:hypothetical protein
VQFEYLGAEPQADPEAGAHLGVDMDFHREPPDTASNSRLRCVNPRSMKVGR